MCAECVPLVLECSRMYPEYLHRGEKHYDYGRGDEGTQ